MIDKAAALHLANRLGLGPAPGQVGQISAAGLEPWLDSQLNPRIAELPQDVTAVLHGLPSFGKNSSRLYAEYWWSAQVPDPKAIPKEEKKKLRRREKQVVRETQIARLARAVGSPWQLQEALVEFWFNHFNVYEKKGADKVWIGAYEEEAIRPNTLGRFGDLLLATARHPAMLVYLDNARNVAPEPAQDGGEMAGSALPKDRKKERGINENYAREVMELHTLGVDGGYTQADVVSLAHILTGWTVGPGADAQSEAAINSYKRNKGAFRFAARRHDSSPEKLLGRTFSGDNAKEGEAALLMLAAHPSTAHHISFQLAQYFIADEPEPALVNSMAATFTQTSGDIRSVLKTMATRPQFLAPANFGAKFKTPYRYVVSAARAVGMGPSSLQPLVAALEELGQPLYGCLSPDGYGCTQAAWLDPNALLRRTSFAMRMGRGEFGPIGNGDFAPLDVARLEQTLEPALSKNTLAAVAASPREHRAGAILGSPDFMRC